MIDQTIIGTKLCLFFVVITFLSVPTTSFAMDDPCDQAFISTPKVRKIKIKRNSYIYQCQNIDVELTVYKIKKIFKYIARENNQYVGKINTLEIVDCFVPYGEARYLVQNANKYNITNLVVPESNIFTLKYETLEHEWYLKGLDEEELDLQVLGSKWLLPYSSYYRKGTTFDSFNGMNFIF